MFGRHLRGVGHSALAHERLDRLFDHAALAHLLHHLGHLLVLFQQTVEVCHIHPGTGGNALFARRGEEIRVGAFLFGHRLDQRDLALQHLVVEARFGGGGLHLAHAGHHPHQALHAAHLEHLFQLHPQVVHVEQTLGKAFGHAFGLFGLERLLRALDEGDDIAHAKDAASDAVGIEGFDRVHLFADADKADGFAGDGAHGKCRTAATVAVHPGEDDAGDADLGLKFGGDVNGVLAGQAVNDEEGLARLGDVADRLHFVHQNFVDVHPAGGIEEQHVIAAEGGLGFRTFGDLDGGFALDDGQRVDADLAAEDGKLLHCCRAVGVKAGKEDALAVLFRQPFGELGGGGGFAGALQADHQDRRGWIVDLQCVGGAVTGEDVDQFVMDDLHDHLAGGDGFGDGGTGGAVLHALDELARDRQRDVGLQQCGAHLAQRGDHIGFGQRALFRQTVEDAAKAF